MQDIQDVMSQLDAVSVKERSHNFNDTTSQRNTNLTYQATGINISLTISTTTGGNTLIMKQNGKLISQKNTKNTDTKLAALLGVQKDVTGIYGPYINIFATGAYGIYTYTNQYSEANQQQLIDLTNLHGITTDKYFLYHHDNYLIATSLKNDTDTVSVYNDIMIGQNGSRTTLLSGGFDGFSYDGYHLYAYQIQDQDKINDLYTLYIIDIANQKILQTIPSLPLGPDATFLLKKKTLYTSFGTIDFVTQEIQQHLLAYDLNTKHIQREVLLP